MSNVIDLKKYFKGSNKRINRIFHDGVYHIKDYKLENDKIDTDELESLDFLEGYLYDLELRTKDNSWKTEAIENKFLELYNYFKTSFGKDVFGDYFINYFIYLTDIYTPILNEDKYYIELVVTGIIGKCKQLKLRDKNKVKSILKNITNPILKDKFNAKDDFDLAKMNDIIGGLALGYNPLLISALYDTDYPEDDNLEEGILTLERIKNYYLSQEELRFYYDIEYSDMDEALKKHYIIENILKYIPFINTFSEKYKRIYLNIAKEIISKHNIDVEINDIVRLTSIYLEMEKQIEEFDIEDIKHYIDLGGKHENRRF